MAKKRFLFSKWSSNKMLSKKLIKKQRNYGKVISRVNFPFVKSRDNNYNKSVVRVKNHFKCKLKSLVEHSNETLEAKSILRKLLNSTANSNSRKAVLSNTAKKEKLSFFVTKEEPNIHGILFLKHYQKVSLTGYVQINVLYGEVEINGYSAKGILNTYSIYSPVTSALQYIKDNTKISCSVTEKKKLVTYLSNILKGVDKLEEFLKHQKKFYSVILVAHLNSVLPHILFRTPADLHSPLFSADSFNDAVLETCAWSEVIDEIQSHSLDMKNEVPCSIMFCGGKDVGKSSMARYTMNRMLSRYDSVFYLECDCGQSEFTPPGILSLVKVTQPLLGPPSTHLLKPEISFFYGYISPKDSPTQYIHLIGQLVEFYYKNHFNYGPLIINQQGWVKGLGLALLIDCIRLVSPRFIIQIDSVEHESRNLPVKLTANFVSQQHGWCIDPKYESLANNHNNCKFIHLNTSATHKDCNRGVNKSVASRNDTVAAYFSTLYEEDFKFHGLTTQTWIPPVLSRLLPYKVNWKYLALHVMHQTISFDVILHAFNLALVCLAVVKADLIISNDESELPCKLKEKPVAECVGMGIIRNIDPINKLFYILTPERPEVLQHVNALLKGNVQLPVSYLIEHPYDNHPYFCHDYISVSSKVSSGMKTRFNLKRKPSRNKNTFGEK